VLHIVHSIRSEALLIEQFDFNLLFRWFVSLAICLLTGPAGIALASSPTRRLGRQVGKHDVLSLLFPSLSSPCASSEDLQPSLVRD